MKNLMSFFYLVELKMNVRQLSKEGILNGFL
ncbi:hypothetical protein SAMN05428961_108279 [Paenibacillus sp. OK060]|nr:hypothetical protein SAMN05428961_108279 [Paenibacillus sp. OK060]